VTPLVAILGLALGCCQGAILCWLVMDARRARKTAAEHERQLAELRAEHMAGARAHAAHELTLRLHNRDLSSLCARARVERTREKT